MVMVWMKKREQIQRATDKLLQLAGITEPPVPVEQIAQLRGTQLRYLPFEGDLSGLLFYEDGQIIIGVNKLHSRARQRFTIAHELGHLELHRRNELHIDRHFRVFLPGECPAQAFDPSEIEANSFAIELLLPALMLGRDLRGYAIDYEDDELIRGLADRYEVSLQLLIFRLTNLGLIDISLTSKNEERS